MQGALTDPAGRRFFWAVVGLVGLIALWWIGKLIPHTIAIFTIAIFIAFGVRPIVNVLTRRKIPKWLAITLVYVILILVAVLAVLIVVPLAVEQTQALATNMPAYASTVHGWLLWAEDTLQDRFPMLQLTPGNFDIGPSLSTFASGTLSSVGVIVINTATWLFIAFAAIVVSFYLLLNDTSIAHGITLVFPARRRATARKIVAEVTELFGKYIFGQIVVSAITGLVIAGLSAAIGFKFALILGIISAIAYAVPVIGMIVAQVIALVLCAPQGPWMILWVQVIVFTMARISDYVLVPKIMGTSVGVSPIGVMFAVFAGGELFGIPGLILGIPFAALIKILWRYLVGPWLQAEQEH